MVTIPVIPGRSVQPWSIQSSRTGIGKRHSAATSARGNESLEAILAEKIVWLKLRMVNGEWRMVNEIRLDLVAALLPSALPTLWGPEGPVILGGGRWPPYRHDDEFRVPVGTHAMRRYRFGLPHDNQRVPCQTCDRWHDCLRASLPGRGGSMGTRNTGATGPRLFSSGPTGPGSRSSQR